MYTNTIERPWFQKNPTECGKSHVSGKNPTEWGGVTQPIVRAQPELWVGVAIHPSPKTSIPSRRVRSAHPPGGDFVYIMETVVQNTHGSLRFTMGSVTSPRSAGFPLPSWNMGHEPE